MLMKGAALFRPLSDLGNNLFGVFRLNGVLTSIQGFLHLTNEQIDKFLVFQTDTVQAHRGLESRDQRDFSISVLLQGRDSLPEEVVRQVVDDVPLGDQVGLVSTVSDPRRGQVVEESLAGVVSQMTISAMNIHQHSYFLGLLGGVGSLVNHHVHQNCPALVILHVNVDAGQLDQVVSDT